ncbi:hypothetical protein PHMEG_00022658 [Phytophthora megakarya]|uniref:Uncharacterized protein n=1 Tax=Phytophthora megakarya TaxID=4795 RepID=A0A225VIY5_9STRA|nr:hypothetical protein PHMEG_00022658 [Phytophthora megakarya]
MDRYLAEEHEANKFPVNTQPQHQEVQDVEMESIRSSDQDLAGTFPDLGDLGSQEIYWIKTKIERERGSARPSCWIREEQIHNKWSDLLRSFQIQYCGFVVSVARQNYHTRRGADESPLDYLYRPNMAGLSARLKVTDVSEFTGMSTTSKAYQFSELDFIMKTMETVIISIKTTTRSSTVMVLTAINTRIKALGSWLLEACYGHECGMRGHPSDHCLFEEFYNQIREWSNHPKHMGMLPEAAEKMLNEDARRGGTRYEPSVQDTASMHL